MLCLREGTGIMGDGRSPVLAQRVPLGLTFMGEGRRNTSA